MNKIEYLALAISIIAAYIVLTIYIVYKTDQKDKGSVVQGRSSAVPPPEQRGRDVEKGDKNKRDGGAKDGDMVILKGAAFALAATAGTAAVGGATTNGGCGGGGCCVSGGCDGGCGGGCGC